MATYSVGDGQTYATIALAVAAATASGSVVEICADTPGGAKTYTENVATAAANVTVRGRAGDAITITGTGTDHTFIQNHTGLALQNLTINSAAADKYALRNIQNGLVAHDVVLGGSGYGLYSTKNPVFNRCSIVRVTGFYAGWMRTGATPTFNLCTFERNGGTLWHDGSGQVTYNNCIFAGSVLDTMGSASGAAGQRIDVNNSVFLSNMTNLGTNYVVKNSADYPYYLNNCVIHPRATLSSGNMLLYGGTYPAQVTEANTLRGAPRFVSPRYHGQFALVIDDSDGISQWSALAQTLNGYAVRCCLALSNTDSVSAEEWAIIRARVAEGHEIISHARDAAILTGFASATDATLVANVTGSKEDIETNIPGYTCTCFAAPQGLYDANLRQAILNAGYTAARKQGTGATSLMSAFKPFWAENLMDEHVGKGDVDGYTARERAAALGEFANYTGRSYILVSHPESYGGAAYSNTDWLDLVKGLLDAGVKIRTMRECVSVAIDGGTESGSGFDISYAKTLIPDGDYHLGWDSPCIKAGVTVAGLTNDLAGRPFRSTPSVGAYEWFSAYGFDSIPFSQPAFAGGPFTGGFA